MSGSSDEIWKDIKGYEGVYQVSNHGRIKSVARKIPRCHGEKTLKESIRTPVDHSQTRGYSITLILNKRSKHCLVSRLVAEAFLPNPYNYKRLIHLDGNKKNNHVSNLAYRPSKETYEEKSRALDKVFACLGVSNLDEAIAEIERLKREISARD